MKIVFTVAAWLATATFSFADMPIVTGAVAKETARGVWSFSVTIRHGDTGWDDYADGWSVEDSSGNELGFRKLLHPHVDEQPFTRSLSGVAIPRGTPSVFIRPRDLSGFSSDRYELQLR